MTQDYDKPATEYFSKRQDYDKFAPEFFRKQGNQWTPVDSLAPTSPPITPPPELRRQWLDNDHLPIITAPHELLSITKDRLNSVIDQVAQWGADQELEACCEAIKNRKWFGDPSYRIAELRAARRPKPPSLKEQALEDLESLIADLANHGMGFKATNIRRALEQLDD
jgi:hypothetical protein